MRGKDQRRLLVAAATLVTVRVMLKTVGFRKVRKLLDNAAFKANTAVVRVNATEVASAVVQAARALPGNTCLVQALAAEWLIKRGGGTATLHLGVAPAEAGIQGHAWLESDGSIILGANEAAQYTRLQG